MANTWARDPNALTKRVYYEGADTVYEGMALCYNYDSTTNWTGWGAATLGATETEQATTAEGEQNEGKFIRVEKPATANLPFFAGVVAPGDWCGTSGPCVLDVYVPNGAIVPVYTGSNVTIKDKMYLANAAYTATSTASDNSFIGLAVETVDRSGTSGLCFVQLQSPQQSQVMSSLETLASDNAVAIASIETIASDNAVAIASIETIASDNAVAIASIETIASDNAVAIASIETIASDNAVAIASIETIASDNAVAIASIETIASDNAVAIASVETIASDAQAELDTISDGLASGLRLASDALTSYTTDTSSLQGQIRKAISDLIVAVG